MSPDKRKHRGPAPKDHLLFSPEQVIILKKAAADYCWLLDRNYSPKAALKLVGDKFKLQERQRQALDRCCQPLSLAEPVKQKEIKTSASFKDQTVTIDGFNLLIILEAALSGAPLFKGRDSLIRDISGLHGSYRKITETPRAIELVADFLRTHQPTQVFWIFDKPVSNSGRLAKLVDEIGQKAGICWSTSLEDQTDNKIAHADGIVISSDSQILLQCEKWFNLSAHIIEETIPDKWMIDIWK
ncbi:hypothetical protein BY457_111101 [Marinilabilia salmonicolor]|jgi:hypothetical protein|uniref:DUF434 domain-containing protein n=1 Tax=Marinilabilia salmonicolor TaxID=989 RepID=UPI000D05BE9A|nr:DUF434 domain-containing protein [Marinilabilia salmonicolor]PRY97820.1 hypothetical protein BY457_111101 [Marinilabilia salmonicolor]